jgi:hypothetical protein
MKPLKSIATFVLVVVHCHLVFAAENISLVYFDQPESAQLFQEAETKTPFWILSRYFVSEQLDTFCGIASSVMVLNALDIPAPPSPFIYPYKKFDQNNIFNEVVLKVKPGDKIGADGLTLQELSALLKTFRVNVVTHHADAVTADQFRQLAVEALKSTRRYMLVNFSRTALGQIGNGHISPLAAYHEKTDRFLIMDVARYKYPPAWVRTQDLWNAMHTEDPSAKQKRGFVIVSRQ